MTLLDQIIPDISSSWGAPMGRENIGARPEDIRVYDRIVPMSGEYDIRGAYWSLGGARLRVSYTKDLSFIRFYREGE